MTRHSRINPPLPIDQASGAVTLDYGSARLGRRLRAVYQALRNRIAAHKLYDMTDEQLADIGLTRADLRHSFVANDQFDPTIELAWKARTNARQMRRL
ncbi:DUF1127 domain-containing protein [Pseudohoeflea suaedae]|uniref:DUF1127 domain-containing protein n=1 Tax=Pseudohoeflea suaedae TaxID=877384 RepID=A0A4R5PN34_9HYPH|nr:DUF1127 domain-containing protein [Pseudohoeflea suaedae]TDH38454.1 DUF1127 domain-containing protein [Pseudohoeflea suaedae]